MKCNARTTAKSTVSHFVEVVVNPSLHHPGPGLPIWGRAPLVWDGRRLELNDHLPTRNRKATVQANNGKGGEAN